MRGRGRHLVGDHRVDARRRDRLRQFRDHVLRRYELGAEPPAQRAEETLGGGGLDGLVEGDEGYRQAGRYAKQQPFPVGAMGGRDQHGPAGGEFGVERPETLDGDTLGDGGAGHRQTLEHFGSDFTELALARPLQRVARRRVKRGEGLPQVVGRDLAPVTEDAAGKPGERRGQRIEKSQGQARQQAQHHLPDASPFRPTGAGAGTRGKRASDGAARHRSIIDKRGAGADGRQGRGSGVPGRSVPSWSATDCYQ